VEISRRLFALVLGASVAATFACGRGDSESDHAPRPVVEAAGIEDVVPKVASDVPTEALASLEKVYVPLSGKSLLSLDDALAERGYGNVKSSDFRPQFEYVDARFGRAVVAYSSGDWVPGESLFQPMSVTQWLEAALSDAEAAGVVINPGHPGQILALDRTEIADAMGWLPPRAPLPMEIYIAR